MEGWISLYRKFMNWQWYKNSNVKAVFIHLLLCANHKEEMVGRRIVHRGQLITSRDSLSEATGLSVQQIRTCLAKLESTNEIEITPTNKYTVITILKYDYYPSMEIALSPEFTETLGAELPSENVLKAVRECIINYRGVYDTYKTQDKKMEQFETLTEALTPEFLIEQAGKFGKDFISIIPQNHPYRLELLESAISHDGFKSLGTLNVNEFVSTTIYLNVF